MYKNFQLVVLAGGKGTRLKRILKKKSKVLIKINKKTLLENIFNQFINIKKKLVLINKNQNDIINFLKKSNKNNFLIEEEPLGDGGCLNLLKCQKEFKNLFFLVVPGDLLINANINNFIHFHLKKKSDLTFWCHPTNHVLDSDLINCNTDGKLIKFYDKPHLKDNLSNLSLTGIYIIRGKLLKFLDSKTKPLSSRFFFKKLLKKNVKAYCYISRDYIKDVGVPDRLKKVRNNIKKNNNNFYKSSQKVPAIFLDRDGVINKENNGELYSNPLNILPGVITALKKINESKYLSIVITNQPSIAKGFLTIKKFDDLTNKFNFFISSKGCFVNKIYYCPHHPNKGFKGEITKLKIICNCRKPKIGLITKAVKDLNIDLKNSIFIGNSLSDYQCALNANIRYFHIGKKDKDKIFSKKFKSLLKVIKFLKL